MHMGGFPATLVLFLPDLSKTLHGSEASGRTHFGDYSHPIVIFVEV